MNAHLTMMNDQELCEVIERAKEELRKALEEALNPEVDFLTAFKAVKAAKEKLAAAKAKEAL